MVDLRIRQALDRDHRLDQPFATGLARNGENDCSQNAVAAAGKQAHALAKGRFVFDLWKNPSADRDNCIGCKNQCLRFDLRDNPCFFPSKPQRVVAWAFALGNAFIDIGWNNRGLADARISRILWVSGRSCASGHEAVGDSALGEIIWCQFDQDLVAGENANSVLAHLAGGMTEDLMAVLEAHAEHRIGQQLNDRAAHLE
jgi:hypothetical protein